MAVYESKDRSKISSDGRTKMSFCWGEPLKKWREWVIILRILILKRPRLDRSGTGFWQWQEGVGQKSSPAQGPTVAHSHSPCNNIRMKGSTSKKPNFHLYNGVHYSMNPQPHVALYLLHFHTLIGVRLHIILGWTHQQDCSASFLGQ